MTCWAGCSGTITEMSFICTGFSDTENWSVGENQLSYIFSSISSSAITVGFSGIARVSGFNIRWNLPTTFSLMKRNDTGPINSTPRAISYPVIRLQHGCSHTLPIPVNDPDGDIVRCRWAVGSNECGDICNRFPGAILDSTTCTFTYEANGATGYNAAAIMIEDFIPGSLEPLSSVALQFVIFVFTSTESCSRQPQFISPTLLGGTCLAIPSGATFTTQIIASSGGQSVSVTQFQITSPLGLRRSEIQQVPATDIYFINITWTPQPDQENKTHLFCYTAINSGGAASEKICVQLFPGFSSPQADLSFASPNQDIVHPYNTIWTLSFDQLIQRPSSTAFVRFFDSLTGQIVYQIDASLSPEIFFNNNSISINPDYQFLEKATYYIILDRGVVESVEGCAPGNEPLTDKTFWTFETMDITPPEIEFTVNPSRSNQNIMIIWIGNEEVIYTCVLLFESESSPVNCSQALWSGQGLSEGAYQLEVTAADLANNFAAIKHSFIVDLTPPNTVINQRPSEVSNQDRARITFSCNEDCNFECSLYVFNTTQEELQPCNQQVYFTSFLQHNTRYIFMTVATDDVGNKGEAITYTWETDFEDPQISSLPNSSTLCSEVDPDVTGTPTAVDNRPEEVSIFYKDSNFDCYIERTWTATDVAGNTDSFEQVISLEFSVSISLIPFLAFACDSTLGTFATPQTTTASAPNPCQLPLDLSFVDAVPQVTCPGEFTRNWTAQACGSTASAIQLIRFFDTCPPNACGRNESPPRGICSFGECSCSRPWFGTNCSVLINEPQIGQINDIILKEAETYMFNIPLIQGTPPLSWTLVSSPDRLRLIENMQQIVWTRAQAGNHTVSVRVENEVGVTTATWTLIVKPGYTAIIDPVTPNIYPRAQPVTLTGRVEYFEDNLVQDFLAGIVPVAIDITRGGSTRTINTFTGSNGSFSTVFHPASTEYGSYTARARHPSSPPTGATENWSVLGLRPIPSSVSLSGEALSDFRQTFYNATMICNDGPAALTGLRISTNLASKSDLKADVQGPLTGTLETGECLFIDITINASRPLSSLFLIEFETDQGASTSALVNLRVQQILPQLKIDPPRISSRLVRGTSTVFQFNVINVGSTTAHNVEPVIPDTPVFSFIGLGNSESSYGDGQFNLSSGESASLSIQAMVSDDMPLGEISASLYIVSDEVSQQIPVSLTLSSDLLMNLTIIVEDEYTYFASGEPLVSDAIVTIINYQRDIRTTLTTEEGDGSTLFMNIFEDRYEVFIEAPDHRPLHEVVITSINNPTLTFFLERQAVTYTWSVTPVTFEDTYTLTLEADFETNVPIPVVTVSPTEFDLEELELGFTDSIQLNITNYGLIRADNVNLNLPTNHPFLEFTVDSEVLGDLEALSSVTAVVHISQKNVQKRAVTTTVTWIIYIINIVYSYVCRKTQSRGVPVILRKEVVITETRPIIQCISCGSRVNGGGGRVSGGGSRVIGGGSGVIGGDSSLYTGGSRVNEGGSRVNGGGRVRPLFIFNGYSASTPVYCNKCLKALIGCVPKPKFPLAGCIPLIVSSEGIRKLIDVIKWTNCIFPQWVVSRGICIYDVYDACLSNSSSSQRKRRSLLSIVQDHLESMYPTDLSIDVAVEVLGDDLWLSVGDPDWVSLVLALALDDASEGGVLISQTELTAILSVQPPLGTTTEDVERLVDRLNNTLSGWSSGVLEPIDGANMASYSFVESMTSEINRYNEIAINKGFTSYLDAYTFSANKLNQLDQWPEEEEGVCAVVRIRIEQELAITREAFLARLEIENQEHVSLEQMTLEIMITDSNDGSPSTHLFAISNETLSGSLVRAGDSWTLMSGESGSVEWLIVPLSEAAPETDRVYGVGGTLRYTIDNENLTIPLLPTLITVTPDPSLLVHYFWERTVVGDDPFTEEVEPSVPFTLGVIVKNAGYGVASSLTLSSGQPEIIENERGLLINYMIIGANIGNGSITPSLSLTLGDLNPQSTVVVRWFMISSLQGEFKNFSATFQNINPLGDSRLSILDELEIHELTRNVRIYNEDDDGILDFLANEQQDIGAYPDALYDSKTLTRYNVSEGEISSIQRLSDPTTTLQLTTVSNETGWNYYRYTDTRGYLSQAALTLNTTKQTSSGPVQIPPENSWITYETDDEVLVLHLVDFVNSTENVSFVVSLCTSNCTAVSIPYTRPTGTPPLPTTMMTTASTTESVTDRKEITTPTMATLTTAVTTNSVSDGEDTPPPPFTMMTTAVTTDDSVSGGEDTPPPPTMMMTTAATTDDSVRETTTDSGSVHLVATLSWPALLMLLFVFIN